MLSDESNQTDDLTRLPAYSFVCRGGRRPARLCAASVAPAGSLRVCVRVSPLRYAVSLIFLVSAALRSASTVRG